MHPLLRNVSELISGIFPLKALLKLSPSKIILPFYHTVSDKQLPHICHLYAYKNSFEFNKDLDFLQKNFQPVSLKEVLEIINGNLVPEKHVFHLTFDDGLRDAYETIAPILLKRNIPATFFINSEFCDNKGLFYRYKASLIVEQAMQTGSFESLKPFIGEYAKTDHISKAEVIRQILKIRYSNKEILDKIGKSMDLDFSTFLREERPYLTNEQVLWLKSKGFEIGSHSVDHPLFGDLNTEDQISQIVQSAKFVNNTFGSTVRSFAFPFTDNGVSDKVFDEIGKKNILDLTFGSAGIKNEMIEKHLQRIPIEEYNKGVSVIIKTELLLYALKKLFGKHIAKRSIGN